MTKLEEYFNHNKSNDLFVFAFNNLINQGYERVLEEIAKIDINFSLLSFNKEFLIWIF